MITLLMGENTFENERLLTRIIGDSPVPPEKIDGSDLELKNLPDLLMGGTLFASNRLVIIKNLSENKSLWGEFEPWIARTSTDTHLVLVDPKPDKRSKTYKSLQKSAAVHESHLWTERDTLKAQQWVAAEARELGFELNKKSAQFLVERVGLDQWALYDALEKLALAGEATPQKIEELVEANPAENVFNVFDAALKGDALKLSNMLGVLRLTEDPYRLFGLLSTQCIQFVALAISRKPSAEVAKELGVHPFALSKLAPYTARYDRSQLKGMITAFAAADERMKTSAADPWLCIEKAMLTVCTLK